MIKIILCLCLIVLMSACTASATPEPSNTGAAVEATSEEMPPAPVEEATVEDTPIGRGEVLFNESRGGFACATCHYNSEARLLGPGLANTAARFESYGLEGTVEDYLHTSIANPTAFIAPAEPAYPENIMPLTYSELFTEEEIRDIIAYILSL